MLLMLLLVLPCHKQSYKPNCIITVISKQIIGQTKRDPGDFSNPTTPGHVERNEFDSHAYTCCAGANWTPMLYTGELCAVSPFLSTYEPVQDIPVSRCCTVWTSDKGKEYLFFGNEMLWFGNTLENSLMNSKQLRSCGLSVKYDPSNASEFGIDADEYFIPFDATGTIVYFDSQVPTEW